MQGEIPLLTVRNFVSRPSDLASSRNRLDSLPAIFRPKTSRIVPGGHHHAARGEECVQPVPHARGIVLNATDEHQRVA